MVVSVDEFQKLKRLAEKTKAEKDRAEGALEHQLAKLNEDYGCATEKDADKLLAILEKEEKALTEEYDKEMAVFTEKWGDLL